MNDQVESWRPQDWCKDTRHYSIELKQNLFGQWVVMRCWGRKTALQGQSLEASLPKLRRRAGDTGCG
ncbi:MAG: hypothetical protein WA947_19705 [Phormidesmis sp.]